MKKTPVVLKTFLENHNKSCTPEKAILNIREYTFVLSKYTWINKGNEG